MMRVRNYRICKLQYHLDVQIRASTTNQNSQAVIKEALRLHAPTCFPLERVVPPEGLNISGHFIPANTIVGTTAPLMNMNREVFGSDVDLFRPERWLDNDAERKKLMNRTFFTVSTLSVFESV